MKNYIKPVVKSFNSPHLGEIVGSAQTAAYMTLDGYKAARGVFLNQGSEYKYCELNNLGKTQICKIDNEGGVKNV